MNRATLNRALLLMSFLIFWGSHLLAANLDSLEQAAQEMPHSAEKAHVLIDLAAAYNTINPQKALEFALQGM